MDVEGLSKLVWNNLISRPSMPRIGWCLPSAVPNARPLSTSSTGIGGKIQNSKGNFSKGTSSAIGNSSGALVNEEVVELCAHIALAPFQGTNHAFVNEVYTVGDELVLQVCAPNLCIIVRDAY